MDIDKILSDWETDSEIGTDLIEASRNVPLLHSKYLNKYSIAKLEKIKLDSEYARLIKNKWEWYSGRLTKQEIDDLGWSYDPFNGNNKPLKNELQTYILNSDDDILLLGEKIKYLEEIIATLKEILESIKWRHTHINNIITWHKFQQGA